MTKQYVMVNDEEYIEFRCKDCKKDDTVVRLPKSKGDYLEDVICYRCCSQQTSGC